MQNNWYLVLVQIQLFAVKFLKRVFLGTVYMDDILRVVLIAATLLTTDNSQVFHVAERTALATTDRLKVFILGQRLG